MDKNRTATPEQVRELYYTVALKLEEVGTAWERADVEVAEALLMSVPDFSPDGKSALAHFGRQRRWKVAKKVAFLRQTLLPTLFQHAAPPLIEEVERVVGLADFDTPRTDVAGLSISNWDTSWDDSGLQEEFDHLARLLRAKGESPSPQEQSLTKRRRVRAQAPPGWIYVNDAAKKYSIPSSTLQDWVRTKACTWSKKDEDSGQVRVTEAELIELLEAKGRLPA